jgi:hypothetical protein
MKGKLNKVDNGYVLLVDNIMYATDNDKLSKQNCDEIFGIVDVDKLAEEFAKTKSSHSVFQNTHKRDFKAGFNKAMELNEGKVFTLEDVKKAYIQGKHGGKTQAYVEFDDYIQSLQQPTEIEITFNPDEKDSDGCLILKRFDMRIEPTYVTFEQARLLEEKGFNVKCLMKYQVVPSQFCNDSQQWKKEFITLSPNNAKTIFECIAAPEQWQVVEWLRINHDIWVSPGIVTLNRITQWFPRYFKITNGLLEIPKDINGNFNTPQEAYSAAFNYTLKELI